VDGSVEPIGTHLLVRSDEPEEITKGGILLIKKESPKAGEVVAVGPGEADPDSGVTQPMSVVPGVQVMYGRYAGSDKVEFGGAEHAIIKEDEVLLMYAGAEPTLDQVSMPTGKVLVKLLEGKEQTDGGLFLAREAVEKTSTVGEVVAVGPCRLDAKGEAMPPPVAVGDMVRFRYGDEVDLDLGGDRLSVVRMSSLMAKWRAPAA